MGSARIQVLLSALLFSTGGAAIKWAECDAWAVASGRSLIAGFFLLLVLPSIRKHLSWGACLVGIAQAATLVLFVVANKLTLAGNASFLQSTAPLHVLVFGVWLLGERPPRRELLVAIPFAAGLVFILLGSSPVQRSAPQPDLGNLLATICGVTWALTLLGLRFLGKRRSGSHSSRDSALAAVVIGNLLAGIAVLPFALPEIPTMSVGDHGVVLYLGLVQVGLAYVFLARSVEHLPAFEISLLSLLEPVLGPLWTWIIHQERLGLGTVVGGGFITVGVALQALSKRE